MNEKEKHELKELLKGRCGDVTILNSDKDTFNFKCKACGKCCTGREGSQVILLSPYDIFNLAKGLGKTITQVTEEFTKKYLGPDTGLIIYRLATTPEDNTNKCKFLIDTPTGKKCSVHAFKPNICRIFPLGRTVNNAGSELTYIFQHQVECQGGLRSKDKVEHSLDEWIPNRKESELGFLVNSKLIKDMLGILKFRSIIDNKEVPTEFKCMLIDCLEYFMYINYDTEKDFFIQQKDNAEQLLNVLQAIGNTFTPEDREEFVGSKFEEKTDEEVKAILRKVSDEVSEF